MTTSSLTVLFEDPFWIGLFEIIDQKGLRVCKVTFGAEPMEKEVMEFVDKHWNRLQFSPMVEALPESAKKISPKRRQREAKKQMLSQGVGTKSWQALKLRQEQNRTERKHRSKAEREAEKQRQFNLRQAKRRQNIEDINLNNK